MTRPAPMRFKGAPAASFRASRAATTTLSGCPWNIFSRPCGSWAGRRTNRCSSARVFALRQRPAFWWEPCGFPTSSKESAPARPRRSASSFLIWILLLDLWLRVGVVLLVVDVLGSGVLFLVDLLLLAGCKLAAVCRAIRLHLLVDALLLVFELGGFAGSQLAALYALGYTVLLILAALPNLIVTVMRGIGVVLVLINLIGKLVLLRVDLLLFGLRQLSAVGGAVGAGFTIDGSFFRFQVGGFTRGQLAALYALRNAVLLILLALRNRWLLRWRRAWRAGPLRSRTAGAAARSAGGGILCQRHRTEQQHRCRHNRPLRELDAHDLVSFLSSTRFPGTPCNTQVWGRSCGGATGQKGSFIE